MEGFPDVNQANPILTTCSSRESGDSTRTSPTSRKTMATIGSICSSERTEMKCYFSFMW